MMRLTDFNEQIRQRWITRFDRQNSLGNASVAFHGVRSWDRRANIRNGTKAVPYTAVISSRRLFL